MVARLRLRDPEEEAVKARLEAAIAEALAALPPPGDWGRDPTVPQLIRRYLALRDEVYGKVLDADPTARGLDEAETARLAARVEALSEAQRLELATPDPAVLEDPEDPWNLDELTARRALGADRPALGAGDGSHGAAGRGVGAGVMGGRRPTRADAIHANHRAARP